MILEAIAEPSLAFRILVIDDDRDTAETMARFLKAFGHDVQTAFDGYEAIEIARRQRPEYVLLDLALPGLDGYQIAARLRQELAGPFVIIAVTGYGREEDRQLSRQADIDYHLLKPIDLTALLSLLAASRSLAETSPGASDASEIARSCGPNGHASGDLENGRGHDRERVVDLGDRQQGPLSGGCL
jgi:CheY-like chemotaxis protein